MTAIDDNQLKAFMDRRPAETVAFLGGRIRTMEPAVGEPDTVVVTGDRIAAVGDRAILDGQPDAHVVDLAGRTLLPGFIDAHNHLSLAALHPRWADLSHCHDTTTLQSALRAQARDEPGAPWVRGAGWELGTSLPLTRHDLDALGLDRPVIVVHFSGLAFPDLADDARRAADRGFALATHAMGNAGLQRTLTAYRDVRRRRPDDLRLRVEHATLAGSDEIRTLADLGAVAVVQPGFVDTVGRRVGHLRFDDAAWMPFADLADAGVALAASSDHPSAPASPLTTSRRATADGAPRDLPAGSHQPLPLHDWLRAWTVGAAVAGGQEHERGSITPGKRADLVVLDGDPADTDTQVVQTWVAGRRSFDRARPDVTPTATRGPR